LREIRKSLVSISRSLLDVIAGSRARKYAVEVDADHAEQFEMPGTRTCDCWKNGDGSVMFILESRIDLRAIAETVKGVRGVSVM
jgi:hypothetical protein